MFSFYFLRIYNKLPLKKLFYNISFRKTIFSKSELYVVPVAMVKLGRNMVKLGKKVDPDDTMFSKTMLTA